MLSTDRPWENPNERILPVTVNWASKLRHSFEFKTDIITTDDGTEQRRAVRNEPRQVLEFDAAQTGEDMREIQDFLVQYQTDRLVMANPIDVGRSVVAMAPGSIVMPIDVRKTWMIAETEVILRHGRRMETRTIAAVNQNAGVWTITFVESSGANWPVGTYVHRVMRGRIGSNLSSSHLTTRAMTMPLKFSLEVGTDLYIPTPVNPANLVGSREIWRKVPNWRNGVDVDYEYLREELDYSFGRQDYYTPNKLPNRVIKGDYIGMNYTDVNEVISFFVRHKGRRNAFLFMTGEDDIPYNAIVGGLPFISVSGQKFGRYYADNRIYRRVGLRMFAGNTVHGLIDQILFNPDTDTSVINLRDNLPIGIYNQSTMHGVSWVLACRMGSDRLDIDWLTDERAQFSLTFQSLENDE